MIDRDERRLLLQIAREAIRSHVLDREVPPPLQSGVAARRGGAFVSLRVNGDLRGCIGHIEADDLVGHVVSRCAVAAASTDPRFQPLAYAELESVSIELSLLGPLERIGGPLDVIVGRHGLVVERGWQRGLLLPQVATEWRWNAEVFLAQTCRKAGLPHDAWKTGATVWRFEAEVFGEGGEGGVD